VAQKWWERWLFKNDERGGKDKLTDHENEICLDIHRVWWKRAGGIMRKFVATASGPDHCSFKDEEIEEGMPSCSCGEALPTRRHWLWESPDLQPLADHDEGVRPRCRAESGLVVPIVRRTRTVADESDNVTLVLEEALEQSECALAATDGGAED